VGKARPADRTVRSQQRLSAARIGACPAERRAPLLWQRFRQDQQAIKAVGQAQARGRPEWQSWRDIAEQPAERRAQNEAGPERNAYSAEHRGALIRRRPVRDIS